MKTRLQLKGRNRKRIVVEERWKQWKGYNTDAECEELCHRRSACLHCNRMILWKSSPCLQIQENKAKWIDTLKCIERCVSYEITSRVSCHCKISFWRETQFFTEPSCALYTICGTLPINVAMLPSHTYIIITLYMSLINSNYIIKTNNI